MCQHYNLKHQEQKFQAHKEKRSVKNPTKTANWQPTGAPDRRMQRALVTGRGLTMLLGKPCIVCSKFGPRPGTNRIENSSPQPITISQKSHKIFRPTADRSAWPEDAKAADRRTSSAHAGRGCWAPVRCMGRAGPGIRRARHPVRPGGSALTTTP